VGIENSMSPTRVVDHLLPRYMNDQAPEATMSPMAGTAMHVPQGRWQWWLQVSWIYRNPNNHDRIITKDHTYHVWVEEELNVLQDAMCMLQYLYRMNLVINLRFRRWALGCSRHVFCMWMDG
jgi:hypothetical protein